jgi:hypothetical protein
MAVSKNKSTANETTVRHLWLAGLGLVAVTRREAIATAGRVLDGVGGLKQRVECGAADAQVNIRHGLDGVRGQVEPKLAKIRVAQFSAEVESRLSPVLVKLGLKPQAKAQRSSRKPAAKKAVRRATARKPAKATRPVVRKTQR